MTTEGHRAEAIPQRIMDEAETALQSLDCWEFADLSEAEYAQHKSRLDNCWQVPEELKEAFLTLEDAIGEHHAEAVWEFMKAVKEAGL